MFHAKPLAVIFLKRSTYFFFRGARHGHKMKAKLQRIADMEEKLLKELQTKNSTPDADVSEKKKDKKKKKKSDKKDFNFISISSMPVLTPKS